MSDNIVRKKGNYKIWIVVVVILLAGTVIYFEYPQINSGNETVINILTYSSLLQYGPNPNETLKYVFGNFENWYHVKINLIYASGDLMTQLSQSKGQNYDIVIGLSNIDAYAAKKTNLFYNFTVSNETYLNKSLFNYLGYGNVIPYEYSFLTNDFNYSGPVNSTIIQNLSYFDLYNRSIKVQSLIPLNEWMYPASSIVALPSCYSVNPNPSDIIPLNEYMNATYVGQNIEQWLLEWEEIEG